MEIQLGGVCLEAAGHSNMVEAEEAAASKGQVEHVES